MLHIPSIKINNVETRIWIALVPDDRDYSTDDWDAPEKPFGVTVIVEVKNWTTGNNLKLQTAGLWGINCDAPMDYVVEIAKEEFETLKSEYPDICKNLIVDNATPARFI